MTEEDLKPCHCGTRPTLYQHWYQDDEIEEVGFEYGWAVECPLGHEHVGIYTGQDDKQDAIEAWNDARRLDGFRIPTEPAWAVQPEPEDDEYDCSHLNSKPIPTMEQLRAKSEQLVLSPNPLWKRLNKK